MSARKLGISSPTPSIEGLHFVLTLAAQRALRLKGLDVSHAFMHSPLPHGHVIVLKLPLSVSMLMRILQPQTESGPRNYFFIFFSFCFSKDLNKGMSARKLGISSPTPSIEGLMIISKRQGKIVLTLAAQRALRLKGLDVSHAFMHSPEK